MFKRSSLGMVFISVLITLSLATPAMAINPQTLTTQEVRAFWVDAFHDGAKTPAQIDKLVNDALKANINTIIVQVRRRGDAYYNNSFEPRTEDPVLPPGFDALQYLIDKAHADKIEVHAWLNTLVAWNSSTPPKASNHVWNLHGPLASGKANWVSYYRTYDSTSKKWSEQVNTSYYLDPGHPDVLDYTADVYLNVIRNYDVDGIHLDYSRYVGLGWGYNPTSVARYNARYGTIGLPSPDDPQWAQWRREQTANLMRKIYLKAIAIKPCLKVSSAVIAWGRGPIAEDEWAKSEAYAVVAQDWRSWLEEGIIDLAIPMNYDCEWNTSQKLWYDQWNEWEKNHQYHRQIVIGPATYMQYIEQSLEQIRRAQAPSSLGNHAAGVSLYAYGTSNIYSCEDYKDPNSTAALALPRQPHVYMPETNDWIFHLLSSEGSYLDPVLHIQINTEPVFPTPTAIPDMPWKSHPKNGFLMGKVIDSTGKTCDHLKITIDGCLTPCQGNFCPADLKIHREIYTDGSGWYGVAELPPGNYRVSIDQKEFAGQRSLDIVICPGRISEANF